MRYSQLPAELKARIDNQIADGHAKPQRSRSAALGAKKQVAPQFIDIPGALFVLIVRRIPSGTRKYDDDNFSGGCKQFRDAISEALGRKSDSPESGITFGYEQVRDRSLKQPEILIEIYKV